MIERRRATGDGGLEARGILQRRLSAVVYRSLTADVTTNELHLAA